MRRRCRSLSVITAVFAVAGVALGGLLAAGPARAAAPHRQSAPAAAVRPPYGEIVVSDSGSVQVFAPGAHGNVAPIRSVTGAIGGTFGLDLDPAGNIWVDDYGDNAIKEFAATANGDSTPIRTITTPAQADMAQPEGIAVDAAQHLVWVGSFNANTLAGFADTANGSVAPTRKIDGSNVGLTFTRDIWMSPNGKQLWATDVNHHAVQEYSPTGIENQAPLRTIQLNPSDTPQGVAEDAFGVVYVSDAATNSILSFGPASDTTPISTLSGPNTGIAGPTYISIDPAGHLWVAVQGSSPSVPSSVEEFARGAHGNAAPIARISGPATNLTNPWDVVVFGAKPSAPQSLKATSRKKAISLSWHQPSSTGGGVLGYVVRRRSSTHAAWTVAAVTSKGGYVDRSPKRHHRYGYDVIAVNSLGQSPANKAIVAVTKPKHHKHKHHKHRH